MVNEIVASDAYQKIVAAIGAEKPVLMNPEDYPYDAKRYGQFQEVQ